jgi:hypothetical protein
VKISQLRTDLASSTTPSQAHLMPARESRTCDHQQTEYSQQLLVDNSDAWQRARKRPEFSRPIPVLSCSLILPNWLAQYSLQINVCKSAHSWTVNLKPYRIVPRKSELFDAILQGEFEKFRRFFDSRQASVYDRDEDGRTALHVRHLTLNAARCLVNLESDDSMECTLENP